MSHRSLALVATLLALLGMAAAPAVSHAWKVTVYMHGAGVVDEITDANLLYCDAGLEDVSENTVRTCEATGYGSGFIVELHAYVTASQAGRGWVLSHWDEGTQSSTIDCDPSGRTRFFTGAKCKFQIFQDLSIHLYFDDVAAPDTTALSGSPSDGAKTNFTNASFTFDGSDPDARYDCRLDRPGDAGVWEPCGTAADKGESYSGLTTNGQYAFAVRARDPSGNTDGTPRSRTWTVDTVAPSITGLSGPSGTTSSTSGSFTFGATESPVVFLCKGPGEGAFASCSSGKGYSGLSDGPHSFAVYAVDQAGNQGPTVSRAWTVDTTAPVVTLTRGPSGKVNTAGGEFAFGANEAASYQCSLDGSTFTSCGTPYSFAGLEDGAHTFAVRGIDSVGNVGDPVIRTWTVDRSAPDTAIGSGPAEGATLATASATFSFSSPDPEATFECRIDGEAFAPCSSPYTRDGLANGDHVFEVRSRDAAGNVDMTPARRGWTVNSLDADGDGFNRPQDCDDSKAAIHPGARETADNGIDEDCSGGDLVDLDRDRDGASRPLDCNDADASIRPGAADSPRDGVDQDCDGRDADFALTAGTLRYEWKTRGAITVARVLRVSGITPGASVGVSCRGKGCPFKAKTAKPSGAGAVDVKRLLGKHRLRPGAVLRIRVAAPGMTARVITFKMRKGRLPSGGRLTCLPPGAKTPAACS